MLFNEGRLTLRVYQRHLLENLLSIVGLNAVFLLYVFGVKDVTGGADVAGTAQRLSFSVAGLFAWNLLLYGVSGVVSGVSEEFKNGTIEQLMLSGKNHQLVYLIRLITTVPLYLLIYVGTLLLLCQAAGTPMHLDLLTLLHMLIVVFSGFGMGFVVLSLILFLQVSSQLGNLFNLALAPLIFASFPEGWVQGVLPIHLAVVNLREGLVTGQFSPINTTLAVLNALFYLLLGLGLYTLSIRNFKIHGNRGFK